MTIDYRHPTRGRINLTKPPRPVGMEVISKVGTRPCGRWCTEAKGRVCVCTCGGSNHGADVYSVVVGA